MWLLGAASLLSVGFYLLASAAYYRLGFPLDDSWIHLTYARNLAERGEWAFQPGNPSAGSTAPLWSGLLAIGFLLRLAPYFWTYFMGFLVLWGLALVAERMLRAAVAEYRSSIPWAGLFIAAEWHVVWSAVSGMETLLHALLVTVTLGMLMLHSQRYLTLGLLTGLSVWVRPDGVTLTAAVILTLLLTESTAAGRGRALLQYGIGLVALLGAYFLFNLILDGSPLPNTFYAKQAEYSAWQARPLYERFGRLALQFMTGPAVVLLPGALAWLYLAVRRRDWGTLAGFLWFAGYLVLYTLRLPIYQHGRYVIPAMPVYFLWGLAGLVRFSGSSLLGRRQWSAKVIWQAVTGLLCLGFWLLGARAYAQDVAYIESEMVDTARWAAQHLPQEALIAAHDIGALGYFDQHELLDLAGLVSPEVIPIIRDEARLALFLDEHNADYLITLPGFYPRLIQGLEVVYNAGGPFAPAGSEYDMVVYRWGETGGDE